jgi:hypothetical protein
MDNFKWININDSLPEIGKFVLVAGKREYAYYYMAISKRVKLPYYDCWEWANWRNLDFTHWCNIPDKWINITDSYPEREKRVLVSGIKDNEEFIVIDYLRKDADQWHCLECGVLENVLRWMPLPEIPKFK